ncbi:hypothetical protein AVEN_210730-1 [Araneus ventricosus]|uniref:Uncharacterized protein n=1 Tax=Araneus ventricosus TaxID=182803 RepID=A0A4Y2TI74_ARAVE|nr:hypothetical protein AVEN_210730-1 [Araneus ventricosus]
MRSDDIVNVMYRENFPRFNQSACAQRFSNSEKAMQGNKIRRQIAFAELRSATSSVGSRRKKLLNDHVNVVKTGASTLLPNTYLIRVCSFSDSFKIGAVFGRSFLENDLKALSNDNESKIL